MILQFIAEESAYLYVIFGCLLASAFFSSSETAVTSLGFIKVKLLLEQKGSRASALKLWLNYPGRVITTILLFNNVVNILASSVTTALVQKYSESGAVGIATGLTTFWVLVFGEIIPKSFAKAHAEKFALWSMKFIQFGYYASFPIVLGLSSFADLIIRFLSRGKRAPLITEEEIELMVSEGEKAGVLGTFKKHIIERAFDFDETLVREIMTPRPDLTAFPLESPIKDMVDVMLKTGHSRVPVYRDGIDQIVGLVLVKDILAKLSAGQEVWSQLTATDLLREAHFAPDSKPIIEVFKDLRRTKNHMAIIIDEYGGTAGIVTMEDILEEIVGEIQDEHDTEDAKIVQLQEHIHEVVGGIKLDEFFDFFGIDPQTLDEDKRGQESETVAGWVTGLLGQIPRIGQRVQVGPFHIEIVEVSNRRVDKIKVETVEPATSALREEVSPPSHDYSP
ncbi:MAG: hemolysin family protein [Zetaproteobacteria bacterium]|nr:hemolysin family protein [Zetaproteobacteria bacterium]